MKHKLLDLIKAGREKEESDLVPYVNDAPPDEAGSWSAKDQLAHLTAWRQVAVAEMEAVRTGAPGPDASEDDDVEKRKDLQGDASAGGGLDPEGRQEVVGSV